MTRTRLHGVACLAAVALGTGLAACDAAAPAAPAAPATGLNTIAAGAGGVAAFFDCLRTEDALIVSAHRGGPVANYPENAMETFAHTLSRIPAILEIDIQPTADGVLVLMHDDTLDRTTTGTGPVNALTLAELHVLRLRDNDGRETDYRVPTLEQALEWAEGRTILVLDRKQGLPFAEIIGEVEAADAMDRVIWATYSDEEVRDLASQAPDAMIVAAMDSPDDLDRLVEGGATPDRLLTWSGTETPQPELYAALAERGVESAFATLGAWTGSWDSRIEALGDDTLYRRLTDGVRILATDRMFEAYEALPQAQRVMECSA
jgi:glycerophosphoryl diester phosphodiesterase